MNVQIEGDELVIRVGLDALAFATQMSPAFDPIAYDGEGNERPIRVTDHRVWAEAVVTELRRDKEDGTTLLHLAFDKAFANAVDAGADGVSIPGVLS